MLKDFREFALKGNVIDLAVGVIIGAAFGKITNSLVNDVIMPPLGLLLGEVDFSNLYINLSGRTFASLDEAKKAGVPIIAYGAFINTIIEFTIIAFAIYIMVRQINRLRTIFGSQDAPPAPMEKSCPKCLSTIPIQATKCRACTADLPG